MFSKDEIKQQKAEIKKAAQRRSKRAALGSVMRDNWKKLESMSLKERSQWLDDLGFSISYMPEISKEVATCRYVEHRDWV